MKNENYRSSITVNVSAKEAFDAICQPTKWWSKTIEGDTKNTNGLFTYHPGNTWVKFRIAEIIPGRKIVWHVTDCYLPFQEDKTEWKNTDVAFEIEENGDGTKINFTHIGLIPQAECYQNCIKGWKQYFNGSLLNFLTTGEGQPN